MNAVGTLQTHVRGDAARGTPEIEAGDEAVTSVAQPLPAPVRRLRALFDDGRYEELDALVHHQAGGWGMAKRRFDGDGVMVATGRVHGHPAVAFAQDRRFMGGSLGEAHARKICKGMDLADRLGAPVVGLLDSGGARIQEGVASLAGYGEIFRRNVRLSGRVPQISVVLGPCAGGAVYSPAITDFIVLSRPEALMFVTGPKVVKQVLFEDVDAASLGGPAVHARTSGVAHRVEPDEATAIGRARELIAYARLPQVAAAPPAEATPLEDIVTSNHRRAYDVRRVIEAVADRGSVLEIQPDYAKNVVVALARIEGRAVGVVANQPKERAGVLDIDASRKAARFVRTMSAFGIPIVTLVDVPGFMPGSKQEHGGVIVHGAKLLYAYCEARVPRITVILRKAFGGAYIVMSSKHVGCDVNLAWPGAQVSVMGAEGAVEVLHGKELQAAADPKGRFEELCARYREEYMSIRVAAERGWVDEVIEPSDTRRKLAHYLGMLAPSSEAGGHGNVPL
ncbi:MAG TPA: acyl-CoA carboxylase subunit beta [Polyangiaceae bacterium]|jgi:acetyl-CoA carboxylase carboxyltransferase component|nr:acyl-CoA carboxylase subunit beta [Polyangiaceae bacterium]